MKKLCLILTLFFIVAWIAGIGSSSTIPLKQKHNHKNMNLQLRNPVLKIPKLRAICPRLKMRVPKPTIKLPSIIIKAPHPPHKCDPNEM